MTITLVSTKASKPIDPIKLHFPSLSSQSHTLLREIIALRMDELARIVTNNAHCNDPLSKRLFVWCTHALADFNNHLMMDQDVIEEVAARIHELTHEILINPIDKSPLKNPIMVNDDFPVWELRMWLDYQTVCNLPPQEGIEHPFAADLIAWRSEIPIAELNMNITISHAVFKPLQELMEKMGRVYCDEVFYSLPDLFRKNIYVIEKGKRIGIQDLKGLNKQMHEDSETCRKLWQDALRIIVELKVQNEERARQHAEQINQTIAGIEASYQQSLTLMDNHYREEAQIMSRHIDALRGELHVKSAQLGSCQGELANQAGQLRALRIQFSELAAQNDYNRHKAGRRGCIIS